MSCPDPLHDYEDFIDTEEQRRIDEYNRIMDEWERRPTNRELYGNNCYRPDEVALTDEEYALFMELTQKLISANDLSSRAPWRP